MEEDIFQAIDLHYKKLAGRVTDKFTFDALRELHPNLAVDSLEFAQLWTKLRPNKPNRVLGHDTETGIWYYARPWFPWMPPSRFIELGDAPPWQSKPIRQKDLPESVIWWPV